jgi:hypothetical protein
VCAGGIAQLTAGGEGGEAVVGPDLVEQDEYLLFAAGLLGGSGGGLAEGRDEEKGQAGEETKNDCPHATSIAPGGTRAEPSNPPASILVSEDAPELAAHGLAEPSW